MALPDILTDLRRDERFMANVAAWRTLPATSPRYAPLPDALHPALHEALHAHSIDQLYIHQAQAIDHALRGDHVVVVTPTASGKTLCYNLPIFNALLHDSETRALYLFPTKALAQDQLKGINELAQFVGETPNTQSSIFNLSASTYDGDTPRADRPSIRKSARVLLSNPDMLHAGILPYHTNWADFFANLRYVVLDELHVYRGVFGSHVANVLRRLRRLCAHYGSRPQFIATSATIANPRELAERLAEQPVQLVDESGAPQAEKHVILYSPPLYDPERGLRRSATLEAQDLATRTILGGAQTIVFGRSRLTTEVLLTYIRERVNKVQKIEDSRLSTQSSIFNPSSSVRGYRGGYLPSERREIEAGLRDQSVRAVVATNALELGIDIGQLQAAVLCGYPGSIASTWQQMGRVGRTSDGVSLALLVATSGVLDQYIVRQPDFLFERSPEHAIVHADNLMLLVDHVRCAAFELPFADDEPFGSCDFTMDVLDLLAEQGDVARHEVGGRARYFWTGDGYPARQISLRTSSSDSVLIQKEIEPRMDADKHGWTSDLQPTAPTESGTSSRITHHASRIIGQIDRHAAPMFLHEGAIYIHEGRSHLVRSLNLDDNLATVEPAEVDYYTTANAETTIEVLAEHSCRGANGATIGHGDLLVTSQIVGYRRIKRMTHENLGTIALDYPPSEWETSGYWLRVAESAQRALEEAGQWHDSPNDYGPNWQAQRRRVRERDGYRCTECGAPEPQGTSSHRQHARQHDVHHLVPFRVFGYAPGVNERYRQANRLSNLVLVCRACHQRLESGVRVRSGLDGLAYTLHHLAPLHLMCDVGDIGVSVVRDAKSNVGESGAGESGEEATSLTDSPPLHTPSPQSSLPTLFIYERAAAGLGFSARLFELHDHLLRGAVDLIHRCDCVRGCPACVGPVLEDEQARLETKSLTLALLHALRGDAVALAAMAQPESDVAMADVAF